MDLEKIFKLSRDRERRQYAQTPREFRDNRPRCALCMRPLSSIDYEIVNNGANTVCTAASHERLIRGLLKYAEAEAHSI